MSRDLLTETITATKDVGEIQNQFQIAEFDNRMGLITIEWSVAAQMNQDGVTELPAGTYYIKTPDVVDNANDAKWANAAVPDNAIYHEIIVDTHEAKVGSGTITPKLGSTSLTAISSAGVTDDSAKTGTAKLAAADTISIVVASDTVTAGAFTIFVRYFLCN